MSNEKSQPQIGFRSRLKYVVDDLEMKLQHGIRDKTIAEDAHISRVTLSTWMKPYVVIERLDIPTLYTLTRTVNEIAAENGISLKLVPEDLIEFVGWTDDRQEDLSVGESSPKPNQ